jgi:hypothetical protein
MPACLLQSFVRGHKCKLDEAIHHFSIEAAKRSKLWRTVNAL